MKQQTHQTIALLKAALFLACLLPFARLAGLALTDSFGPDPVADIQRATGIWALRLLLLMFALTPLKRWTGWHWLVRLRRTVALYAFFYACLHFLAYLVFDHGFDWPEIAQDVFRRPYAVAGLFSFVLMVPLALTSSNAMMKRLGGRNWRNLHRLAYLIAAAAVLHYFWLVKKDITLPSYYALALAGLFLVRLLERPRKAPLPACLDKTNGSGGMDTSVPG